MDFPPPWYASDILESRGTMNADLIRRQANTGSQGLITLKIGNTLRLNTFSGRHIRVVSGVAWVTQERDLRDIVLRAGEVFCFERHNLAVVTPLGAETTLALEAVLVQDQDDTHGLIVVHREALSFFMRCARRMRAAAMSHVLANIGACLKALCGRAAATLFAAIEASNARCQLRSMDDHMLRDIGIRRDQIHCISKRIPW